MYEKNPLCLTTNLASLCQTLQKPYGDTIALLGRPSIHNCDPAVPMQYRTLSHPIILWTNPVITAKL